ncbi:MAG: N-acetylmuramoyl-L-alanine amidase [Candidatus Krumholzibacteriia bacterium]
MTIPPADALRLPRGSGRPGRRRAAAVVLIALAGLCAAATARPSAAAAETPDPDAFTRLDPNAPPLAVQAALAASRATLQLEGRRLLAGSQEVYVSTSGAAALFGARRDWEEEGHRLVFRAGGRAFHLTAGSRLVTGDAGETLLRAPVFARAGDLWVPLELLTRVVGPALREPVRWDPSRLALGVGREHADVTGLRVEELAGATALHFACARALTYRAESPEPGLLLLKIYGGTVDPAQVALDRPQGLVEAVSAEQVGTDTQVRVRVSSLVTRYRAYAEEGDGGIVLMLEEEPAGALPEPTPRGQLAPAPAAEAASPGRPITVRTVIIDAGHGGDETGRIGPDGALEKDVNLAVARELKRVLEREGQLAVVLTRDDDSAVPLVRRAEIANQAGGDLFVSLHCNGWFSERATGVETYFLSPAKTDRDASVASDENRVADGSTDDLEFILWDLVQNRFITDSSELAESVQAALCRALGAENRGVKQAGFRVLVGAYMPAVLIEMGFLSNGDEEKRLTDPEHQRLLARTIGEAILEDRDRHAGAARDPGEGRP